MDINLDKKLFDEEFRNVKNRILDDPDFLRYLKDNDIDESLADKNLYLLKDIFDSRNKCLNCKGIHMCTQDAQGFIKDVQNIKGVLVERRIFCHYLSDNNKKTAYLNNFKVNDIESLHKHLSFNDIDPTKETDLYKLLYIKLFKNRDSKTGIYLFGNMGVGKSYLMSSYFNDLARDGHKVAYLRTADFLGKMNLYYQMKDKTEFYTLLERVKEAEYVCFDDIGAEMISEINRDQILFPILDYRMSNELPTYFVSNVSIGALQKRYENTFNKDAMKAERLVERIKKLATVFELDGKDKRFI